MDVNVGVMHVQMKLFVPVTSESETLDSLIQLNNLDIVETVAEFQSKGLTIVDFMKNYVNAQTFLKNSGVYIVGVCE